MGLDMYLFETEVLSRTKDEEGHSQRVVKETEIGYWRKAYKVQDIILNVIAPEGEDNCIRFYLSNEQINTILDDLIGEKNFMEEEYPEDIKNQNTEEYWTYEDILDAIEIFKKAYDIVSNDTKFVHDIYYYQWY